MLGIQLTPQAQTDLERIWEYIAEDNSAAADQLLLNINQSFFQLAEFPHTGVARDTIMPGLRLLPIKRISILYFVRDDYLLIARVAYGGQNIDQHFIQAML
ncbi:MAG: hypothetical protein Tsb002_29650 [Wenzhouxiangellaceae bacterium]